MRRAHRPAGESATTDCAVPSLAISRAVQPPTEWPAMCAVPELPEEIREDASETDPAGSCTSRSSTRSRGSSATRISRCPTTISTPRTRGVGRAGDLRRPRGRDGPQHDLRVEPRPRRRGQRAGRSRAHPRVPARARLYALPPLAVSREVRVRHLPPAGGRAEAATHVLPAGAQARGLAGDALGPHYQAVLVVGQGAGLQRDDALALYGFFDGEVAWTDDLFVEDLVLVPPALGVL